MTIIIDGKRIANDLLDRLAKEIASSNAEVCLQVIQVGNNQASSVYVRNKERAAERVGIKTVTTKLDESISQNELIDIVHQINKDRSVNGLLIQLPLPEHLNVDQILHEIDPRKDVDGFHAVNMGKLWTGSPSMTPCTPASCICLKTSN